jgi:hypothetical protein
LDGKLTAEILRMPSKRFNDVSGLRWHGSHFQVLFSEG